LASPTVHDDILGEHVPVPEFLPGAVNVTVREGDVAILPCSVKYLGTKQVSFKPAEVSVSTPQIMDEVSVSTPQIMDEVSVSTPQIMDSNPTIPAYNFERIKDCDFL
ncbi:hypothetical protein Btru_075084, partial [Bulinus truncatus]